MFLLRQPRKQRAWRPDPIKEVPQDLLPFAMQNVPGACASITGKQERIIPKVSFHSWAPALKDAGISIGLAAFLLVIAYIATFRWIHPEFTPFMGRGSLPFSAEGRELIPVSVGRFSLDDKHAVIAQFNEDEAILALPRAFLAEDYPFIKVNVKGFSRFTKLKILWRQAKNRSITHGLTVNRSGSHATQIAMVYGGDNYRGEIVDIALLFYDGPALGVESNDNAQIVVESVEFTPFSMAAVIEQIFEDWTNPPLWRGSANNAVMGAHANSILYPNAVTHVLVIFSIFAAFFRRAIRGLGHSEKEPDAAKMPAVLLIICIFGWAFTDILRWNWRVELLIDAHERYSGKPLVERIRNNPIRCARFPDDCRADLLPFF